MHAMSRDQDWRLGSSREVTYSRSEPQLPAGGIAGAMRGLPQPAIDSRALKGPDLAPGRGRMGQLGSPALPETARDSPARPLGSPALSILAQGRRVAPEAAGPHWQEAQNSQYEGARDKAQRSISVEPPASRGASPADRNGSLQDRPAHIPVMSRLGKQKPLKQSLVSVELPPVLPARATRLHQVLLAHLMRFHLLALSLCMANIGWALPSTSGVQECEFDLYSPTCLHDVPCF